jgi:UDP-N-acetylglucosamine acyltransferase
LGRGCFLAGGAMVEGDVPPFLIAAGDRARVRGVNRVGLRRMQVPEVSRRALQAAYRAIWRSGEPVVRGMRSAAERFGSDPYVRELLEFLSLRHAAQSLR